MSCKISTWYRLIEGLFLDDIRKAYKVQALKCHPDKVEFVPKRRLIVIKKVTHALIT